MKSKIYTDKEITDGILQDNKAVISFLYEYNFELLNKKVISEGGTKSDTQDILHDALLILFLKIRNQDFKLTSSIHTFLQAIARNLWKQFLEENINRNKKIDENLEIFTDDQLEEEYLQVERRKLYLKHLENIPEDCKRLIKLVISGVSLTEITRLMNFNSLEFTKTKRYRCKVFLIEQITKDPLYKNLKNEKFRTSDPIPRWRTQRS